MKGYLDDTSDNHETEGRHVETNGDISVCGRQDVEEERLMKSLQEIVQTPEYPLHNSEQRQK